MALYDAFAPYYDRFYEVKGYDRESARLHRIADHELRRPGRTLLDVGCGTGLHLAHLRRWYEVAGVDLSRAMLRQARRRLGPTTPLHLGDMRSFDLGRRFDVLTCLFSAYGYLLMRRDRDRAAATFYRHLVPGGVALVEGWILPDAWQADRELHLRVSEGATSKMARLSRVSRRGDITTLVEEYLIGEPGRPIRHLREVHRLALVPAREHLASFRRAGFYARVDRSGSFHDRGLYVLRRPPRDGDGAPVNRA